MLEARRWLLPGDDGLDVFLAFLTSGYDITFIDCYEHCGTYFVLLILTVAETW
jgi:hypothetical protein